MKTPAVVGVVRLLGVGLAFAAGAGGLTAQDGAGRELPGDGWRSAHRLVDLHMHIGFSEPFQRRAVKIMDAAGIGVGANLSGGTVTAPKDGGPSAFEKNKALADRLHPGRFIHYMNLDYKGWDEADFSGRAVRQIEEGHRLGAAGLKEYKRLGLYLRDGEGQLIKVDDPKLDPVWKRCGELGMPVSIHVADPVAFWKPYDKTNERWTELKDHRNWWFGDPEMYPPHGDLLAALDRVIGRHPGTTFVGVHFANNPEDIAWVEAALDRRPNMMADLAARVPEIGRHDPAAVRRLFNKHQDRILFATDFMVYGRLILGSGGSGPGPTDEDALDFYQKHWRWLETDDRDFAHMTPIQGDWTIDAIGLKPAVLRKIYFDNARKLLARSLPRPELVARRTGADFELAGDLSHPAWAEAPPSWIDSQSKDAAARPESSTTVRALWTESHLYFGFSAPFEELTTFEPPRQPGEGERIGLWERDVLEVFIGSEPDRPVRYKEFQVAPTGEMLDLALELPERDFPWSSGWVTAVSVDREAKVWRAEMKIPFAALAEKAPAADERWPANFYRVDKARGGYLAWSPTLAGSFHLPGRFGRVRFAE